MKNKSIILLVILCILMISIFACDGGSNKTSGGVWVEKITIGPQQPYMSGTDLRLVCVNLRASESAFGHYSAIGCKVELWHGSYYYGYYNVYLDHEYVSHLEESGVDLFFPIPADEPVFQSGGNFSTKVSTDPRWAEFWSTIPEETWSGLHDNPYKDFVQ